MMASIGVLANDAAVDATIQPISAYNIDLHFQGIAAGKEKKKKNVALHLFLMKNFTKAFGREEKKNFLAPPGRKNKIIK